VSLLKILLQCINAEYVCQNTGIWHKYTIMQIYAIFYKRELSIWIYRWHSGRRPNVKEVENAEVTSIYYTREIQ